MKIGSIVYATTQGLGILARDLYRAGIITDVLIVSHGTRPNHPEWYPPDTPIIHSLRSPETSRQLRNFAREMDCMFFLETPFDWSLIEYCWKHGVGTALMPMHECTPKTLPAIPGAFLCPSALDMAEFAPRFGHEARVVQVVVLPSYDAVRFRQRSSAKIFLHNAGHGGLRGRNGTEELIEAWRRVDPRATMLMRTQMDYWRQRRGMFDEIARYNNVELFVGDINPEALYNSGDVFVFPEKFNGLSLPLQEAYASGMLVMATNRFPNTDWLPLDPLIPISGTLRESIGPAFLTYEKAIVDPKSIAATINDWYGRDIRAYSDMGRQWAERNGWGTWLPVYMDTLTEAKSLAKRRRP